MDDYSDTRENAFPLVVGGPAIRGNIDSLEDRDWFHIANLSKYYHYTVSFTELQPDPDTIWSFYGEYYLTGFPTTQSRRVSNYSFQPAQDGGVLDLMLMGYEGTTSTQYELQVQIVDEPDDGLRRIYEGHSFGFLNSSDDIDYLSLRNLRAGIHYVFELQGSASTPENTLVDPYLELYRNNVLILSSDDDGLGSNARLESSFLNGDYQLRFSGKGGLGTYTFDLSESDDYGNSALTAGWVGPTIDQVVDIRGQFEFTFDYDWFRFHALAGTRYRAIIYQQTKSLIELRNQQDELLATTNTRFGDGSFAFQMDESQDLFLMHREFNWNLQTSPNYDYHIRLQKLTTNTPVTTDILGIAGFFSSDVLDYVVAPDAEQFEFYSTVDLQLDGKRVAAGTLISVDPLGNDLRWNYGSEGVGEIFVRAQADGTWSQWAGLSIVRQYLRVTDRVQNPGDAPTDSIAIYFADQLPDYYEGDPRFLGFQALDDWQRQAMMQAITEWQRVIGTPIIQATHAEQADVVIFMAQTNTPFGYAFYPGGFKGSDIILEQSSDLWANPYVGSQGYFEMLRAFGTALGLPSINDRNREQSLSGLRFSADLQADTFTSTPLPYDILRAQQYYGTPSARNWAQTYSLAGLPVVRTITANHGYETVDAQAVTQGVTIDLRAGKSSFSSRNYVQSRQRTFYNALDSQLERGIGGQGNDWIGGNQADNRLVGAGGNDILIGRLGNDLLIGNSGNDRYIVRFGDGQDMIDDRGSTVDRDVLRVEAFSEDVRLDKDFAFAKFGNDLVIHLQPAAALGDTENRVRIAMHDLSRGVETLNIFAGRTLVDTVDLWSIFQAATSEAQRFSLTGQYSEFGQVAAPIFAT